MNIIAFVTIVVAVTGYAAAQDLSRYADQDLRKLRTTAIASLQSAFKTRTGVQLGEKRNSYPLAPWILSAYDTPKTGWVLVEAYPGYDVPDVSGVKVHFFTDFWTHVCSVGFPTGYRLFLNEVTIRKREGFDCPLVVAKVTSTGPFIISPGPKSPAFEQGNSQLQYYGMFHTNLFMVRLEDDTGRLVRNHYRSRTPLEGTPAPRRTKAQWLGSLESTNLVEQLSALVWVTGEHLSSKDERKSDHNQESLEDSNLFESVRDDTRTASIMNSLRGDKRPWVQEYAKLGISRSETAGRRIRR